jgi:acetate CoA/acetoacetate CoA-transferase beta subunit
LPLTALRRVNLVVTDLAVIEPTEAGLILRERAPGVSVDDIRAATEAVLVIPDDIPEMILA